MMRSYKTEIDPTFEQSQIINRTIGVCRYVYNMYVARNKEAHDSGGRFMSGMEFSKWLNNEYLPSNPDKAWVKEASQKSVKQSIMNAEGAYKRFFKGQSKFPRFKRKNRGEAKMYFVKNDAKTVIGCERHRIKIPTLGWVRVKEKGYIPTDRIIKSGTVSKRAGRYYVSVLADVPDAMPDETKRADGIGIDLGLKEFAVMSDGTVKGNINKTKKVKKTEKKLKREQRRLSRKYKSLKKRIKNKTKGEATRKNIEKQVVKVQRLHQKLDNMRTDYINKIVGDLAKTKPNHITIEDLNVSGMMRNKHLSRAIAGQKFREFRVKLTVKCKTSGIELRIANRFYPSSKLCHGCGRVKTDLKLKDRTYICECGYEADRDYNASLNLRDTKVYGIVV